MLRVKHQDACTESSGAVVVVKPEEQGQAGQSDAAAAETTKPASLGSRIKNRMGARKVGGSGTEPVAPVRRIQLSPVER